MKRERRMECHNRMNKPFEIMLSNHLRQALGKRLLGIALFSITGLLCVHGAEPDGIDFKTEIEPILLSHCIDCHGPDEQQSEFRVDRLASLLAGGNSGEPAVIAGKPQASYLLKLIRHEQPELEMPPDGRLSEEEVTRIEKWIAQGAGTPASYGPAKATKELKHWSFLPLRAPGDATIDSLISNVLQENGLQMSSKASRRTLIRRLYLVMLGIPPTPQQVQVFVNAKSESAWSDLVEQVLASPHYGERWGSYWLDLVRFGETHGFEMNRERPNAWQYRDWVISALNSDKPYNQFVREQIAGDALGADVATSFLVAGPNDQVKGQDPKLRLQQRMNELDDMINTTGTAFMGLTTGCARCHNHKFDPISQRDYYSMQAVFAGVQHAERAIPLSKQAMVEVAELEKQFSELIQKLQPFEVLSTNAGILLEEPATGNLADGSVAVKPGKEEHQFGGKTYRWWENIEGEVLVTYRPQVEGNYRIWLSWGSGHSNHSTNAKYALDSGTNRVELATVNQQLAAGETGPVPNKTSWSGFLDAGVHTLKPTDVISIIGSDTGPYVTADAIFLQPITAKMNRRLSTRQPAKRDAINAKLNEEYFPPRKARFVRFTIEKTKNAEGCIDELEVFSNGTNIALASLGSKATSSGDFVHPLHNLRQINDGEYGNERSWIVKDAAGGWVQIEFPETKVIDHIQWGRDRTGKIKDRLPIGYRIEAATEPGKWHLLASSADRSKERVMGKADPNRYQFTGLSTTESQTGQDWLASLISTNKRLQILKQTKRVYAGSFVQPGPTHRLYRGEADAKREQVVANSITAFNSLELSPNTPEQERRLALADWISSDDNPLTPRVIANRIWQFQFGLGIVDTPNDFGRNGSPPTHPKLLDYLADQLVKNDWSLKHLHRLILNSHTWQQNDVPNAKAVRIDATTRLLWRFPPRRLEAEALRDSILAVTGALDLNSAGGPGFNPFDVEMENVRHYHEKKSYGPADWRRMIYMTKVRQEREHVFGAFDCPDASMVVAKRSRSTTPLQALNLLNSRFIMQQAHLFAERLTRECTDDSDRIRMAWNLCLQRNPTDTELRDSKMFIQDSGLTQFTRVMLNTNEFVFIP
ncbi:MAG: PSD1 and planctomycete cytochrome C domain-containing protein [Rubripirellula sp.]|nr:PSD1 and planctomycete cytochrome C domain-containing protein [Rubripirellula sp.]